MWLARPERITCMNACLLWRLISIDHVVESVLTAASVGIDRVSPYVLFGVGCHARDVLGRYSSLCQSLRLILDLVEIARVWPDIDPRRPRPPSEREELIEDIDLPVFDASPLLEAALGGALVHAAERLGALDPEHIEGLSDRDILAIAREGAEAAIKRAGESMRKAIEQGQRIMDGM